jgi:hypothetical protein
MSYGDDLTWDDDPLLRQLDEWGLFDYRKMHPQTGPEKEVVTGRIVYNLETGEIGIQELPAPVPV